VFVYRSKKTLAKKTIHGICVYCSKEDELTEDHVIPQCLFPNGVPVDVPTVYACATCNHVLKSANDNYLRDLLFTDMRSSRSPIVQELWPKFGRAVRRNQSKLANELMYSKLIELRTASGLFAQWAYTSQEVNEKTIPILSMIVRGLYHYYTGRILPHDITFEGCRITDREKMGKILDILLEMGVGIGKIDNGEVFECAIAPLPQKSHVGVWILNFYRRMTYMIFTGLPTEEQVVGEKAAS
jgi:hypothetical protein